MSTPEPIGGEEMADILRRTVNVAFGCDIAEPARGGPSSSPAPATGQRFRVAVAEVAPWSDQVDAELAVIAGTGAES